MVKANQKHQDEALIDKLGGTSKAAKFFDVDPASVSGWRWTGLPRARMMYLKLARPDLFDANPRRRKSDKQ
jgi:hypothetical protein